MTPGGHERFVEQLQARFEAQANGENAAAMARYMREQFPFLGLNSPQRRLVEQELLPALRHADEAQLGDIARELWRLPEREYQYAAVDLLARSAKRLSPASIDLCRDLIVSKSWWDTVDGLAAQVVGIIVLCHREQVAVMDDWVTSPNLWLRRTALIHQLKFKTATDTERLFRYCLAMAGDEDFFIRKAIGWALRQYSWTDPDAVRAFVEEHGSQMSALSRREAFLRIEGRRKKRASAN